MKGVIETSSTIHFKIEKPKYGAYVGIRDVYLRKGKKLVIEVQVRPNIWVKGVCMPKEWMENADITLEEHLIPGCPMPMYNNHVTRFPYKEELGQVSAISTFTNMPDKYREQLRIKLGLKK